VASGGWTRSRVVVGVAVVAVVGTAVVAWLMRDTDEKRATAVRARLRPAAEALRAATRPTGFQACTNRPDADLCWDGQGSEVSAVPLLVSTLEKVGATDLTPRCVRQGPLGHVFCRVDGRLDGAVLDSLISANGSHIQVVVYAATRQPPDILVGGVPIPLSPSAAPVTG
jgi:hypothetical protein